MIPQYSPARSVWALNAVLIFAPTIFLSAWLLFLIQPLFGRMALPLLGGVPSVWNTAMVFFQAVLLLGYLYAHIISKWLSFRAQLGIHMLVMAVALFVLPVSIGASWQSPPADMPAGWLLALLAVNIGLPFFAISANAPLLQKWFARTSHPDANDPYFLYGASNLGSMIALLGYPLIIEQVFAVETQSWIWTGGYMLLAVMICSAGFSVAKAGGGTALDASEAFAKGEKSAPVAWSLRLRWIILAMVPSGLLISVTTHITADIAAAPLLWVIPLALYLLTYVFVFARKQRLPHRWMLIIQGPLLVLAVLASFLSIPDTAWWELGLALAAFFVTAMVCHGELARRRPATSRLTEFYLLMSFGGILGGAFTALLAPAIFDKVIEYPLLLALAGFLRPAPRQDDDAPHPTLIGRLIGARFFDFMFPGAAITLIVAMEPSFPDIATHHQLMLDIIVVALVFALFTSIGKPARFGFTLLALGVLSHEANSWFSAYKVMAQERSFFGVYTVAKTRDQKWTIFKHGTTLHGAQSSDPVDRYARNSYYHADTGVGRVFAAIGDRNIPVRTIGGVGLGVGEIACYRKEGQKWTFFEIDPKVVRIARDRRLFQYLSWCAPAARVVVGDGRLTLKKEPAGKFDVLVLDAFSSAAVPAHLLTREAFQLYRSRIGDGGIILLHISNRHLDLEPVVANLVAATGMSARVLYTSKPKGRLSRFRNAAVWVAIAKSDSALSRYIDAPKAGRKPWRALRGAGTIRLWTDDFVNVLSVLK